MHDLKEEETRVLGTPPKEMRRLGSQTLEGKYNGTLRIELSERKRMTCKQRWFEQTGAICRRRGCAWPPPCSRWRASRSRGWRWHPWNSSVEPPLRVKLCVFFCSLIKKIMFVAKILMDFPFIKMRFLFSLPRTGATSLVTCWPEIWMAWKPSERTHIWPRKQHTFWYKKMSDFLL